MRLIRLCGLLFMAIVMTGCASLTANAPPGTPGEKAQTAATAEQLEGKKIKRGKEWRPETYTVQKGDTLYGIAFNYGFGYRELADLNGIKNPNAISVGQVIRLFPNKPAITAPAIPGKAIELPIKDQPKLVKYAYSEAALAQIDKVQQQSSPVETAKPVTVSPTVASKEADKNKPDDVADNEDEKEEPALDWGMPTQGKIIAQFSEPDHRKGVDFAGKLGQPIFASAAGKVVYSGSGLRGYGKLIIIKHNATYLSAYAHNDRILVKEGQSVTRGQKIAAMGSTDTNQVKLHFEVRRLGRPVDPAKFLPLGKS